MEIMSNIAKNWWKLSALVFVFLMKKCFNPFSLHQFRCPCVETTPKITPGKLLCCTFNLFNSVWKTTSSGGPPTHQPSKTLFNSGVWGLSLTPDCCIEVAGGSDFSCTKHFFDILLAIWWFSKIFNAFNIAMVKLTKRIIFFSFWDSRYSAPQWFKQVFLGILQWPQNHFFT